MRKSGWIALGAGIAIAFLLPSSWLFVGGDAPHGPHAAHGGDQYACPMFCVIMPEPPRDGKCPVCGMQMTRVSGQSVLSEQEQRMVGLEVSTVKRVPLGREVRVVGEVDYDETRVARITTRAAGWLEEVWADTTWMRVKKGEKLASIYSPELYAAQKEFLIASAGGRDELLEAARRRLQLFGVGDEEIERLREAREVSEALILRAPRDGVVVERHALEGASVKKGDLLYTVADLSRVWVQAEVFERDLVWIFEGLPVRLRLEGRGGDLEGRISFVDPVIQRHTRTARIRIEVDNRDGVLRIGQRVDAWILSRMDARGRPVPPGGEAGEPLAVPRSAVLTTGDRAVAYVLFREDDGGRDYELDPEALPDPVFYEMITLRVGPLATRAGSHEEFYPVLEATPALQPGFVVVTKGNLLLDSQAQLSGKPSLLFPEGSRGSDADPHAGH